jgi:hypothetical protein
MAASVNIPPRALNPDTAEDPIHRYGAEQLLLEDSTHGVWNKYGASMEHVWIRFDTQ